ncbi:hypothetical protein [Halobacillus salinus]|uniref:hypothetical protein n=1 Tax=Halobacillus salinus TaxID=192814 RepID=UPI0013054869|nr:hypothetical protein [Halobacillus salinus]
MPELKTSQASRSPLERNPAFDEMIRRDCFVDGIPLDELQKHLRQTKSHKDYHKKRR